MDFTQSIISIWNLRRGKPLRSRCKCKTDCRFPFLPIFLHLYTLRLWWQEAKQGISLTLLPHESSWSWCLSGPRPNLDCSSKIWGSSLKRCAKLESRTISKYFSISWRVSTHPAPCYREASWLPQWHLQMARVGLPPSLSSLPTSLWKFRSSCKYYFHCPMTSPL